jgi:hypothetical protein
MDRSATHAGVSGAGFHTGASGRSPIKKAGYEAFAGSPAVAATAAAISPPPLHEDIELLVDALTLAATTQHEQGRFWAIISGIAAKRLRQPRGRRRTSARADPTQHSARW